MERDEENAINVRVKTIDGRTFDFLLRQTLSVERFKLLIAEVGFISSRGLPSPQTDSAWSSEAGCCRTPRCSHPSESTLGTSSI